jgi:uncharacterized membrane protein
VAIEAGGQVQVEAPVKVAFETVADLERWPEWARELERVVVLDRGAHGRPTRVRMVADLFGKEFDATCEFVHDEPARTITFRLVEARKLRTLDGEFRLEPAAAGTVLHFQVVMALVKPKAARIERMVARKIDTAFTRDLRRSIERAGTRRR